MQYSRAWAGPATKINNGKMYQIINLPKGKYKFTVNLKEAHLAKNNKLEIICVEGKTMPDINSEVETKITLGGTEYKSPFVKEIDFVVTERSSWTLGFVGNLVESSANFKVTSVSLNYLGDE